MIFVTVGTHEQQFNRLIKYIDNWAIIHNEEVFIQIGYSTYEPAHCEWARLISFKEMNKKINDARIIITHGGPASFMNVLQKGKVPIVVPRKFEYKEHINNHQVDFCNSVKNKYKNIIVIDNINSLEKTIKDYNKIVAEISISMKSNNTIFIKKFETVIEELMKG